ncbi:MAG TPA: hypothetical protein VJ936_09815, partial [Desulfobacteraceae bacterium]|nr:hypothetical protein [Desulfobacteraceae bacterium]
MDSLVKYAPIATTYFIFLFGRYNQTTSHCQGGDRRFCLSMGVGLVYNREWIRAIPYGTYTDSFFHLRMCATTMPMMNPAARLDAR